jgi:hypothetical protein
MLATSKLLSIMARRRDWGIVWWVVFLAALCWVALWQKAVIIYWMHKASTYGTP